MSYIVSQKKNLVARQPHCDRCEHLEIEMTDDVSHLMVTRSQVAGEGRERVCGAPRRTCSQVTGECDFESSLKTIGGIPQKDDNPTH